MLKGFQRSWLGAKAHHLNPIVYVGKEGISEKVIRAADEALGIHELIKVRFVALKEEKKEAVPVLAEGAGAEVVSIIGNVAVLYRMAKKKEDRKYSLPQR